MACEYARKQYSPHHQKVESNDLQYVDVYPFRGSTLSENHLLQQPDGEEENFGTNHDTYFHEQRTALCL